MRIIACAGKAGIVGATLVALLGIEAATAAPIAGLAPNARPAEAPTITTATAPGTDALHGVVKPVPASVEQFMRDQGNWYTPFTVPGMPGPYDIRGWHAGRPAAAKR
jgi:hypothetical protein